METDTDMEKKTDIKTEKETENATETKTVKEKSDSLSITTVCPKCIVLSGAGMYGISFLGILSKIDLADVRLYVGSSFGGIISLFLYIGYSIADLYQIAINIKFSEYQNPSLSNMMNKFGLDDYKYIDFVLKTVIDQKFSSDITFKQLYDKLNSSDLGHDREFSQRELILTGSCINTGEPCYFNHQTTPNMPVLTAVKITMAYPGVFTPIQYDNRLYADGALFDFFPIDYTRQYIDREKIAGIDSILGITLELGKYNIESFTSMGDYFYALYIGSTKNALYPHTPEKYKKGTSEKGYDGKQRSIRVIPLPINIKNEFGSMNLALTTEQKKKLYNDGVNLASTHYAD